MPKIMKCLALASIICTIGMSILYSIYRMDWMLTLAITTGTTAYHLTMRLLVGGIVSVIMHNRADYHKKWYQVRPFERKLYAVLKVKHWKRNMPSYEPDRFSLQKYTFDEIAQTMCQSEIVHEVNVVFSFLPLLAALWFGSFPVFLMTSIAVACFDAMFVIMQRYNRPRMIRLAEKQNSAKKMRNEP